MERSPHPLVALGGTPLPSEDGAQPISGRLSPRVLAHTMSIAEAIFSDDKDPPPVERLAFLEQEYDDLMARSSWKGRLTFSWAARLIAWLGPLHIGAFCTISQLELPRRVEALRRLEERPLGGLLIALRALLCLVYYEHPDAAAEIGIGQRQI